MHSEEVVRVSSEAKRQIQRQDRTKEMWRGIAVVVTWRQPREDGVSQEIASLALAKKTLLSF